MRLFGLLVILIVALSLICALLLTIEPTKAPKEEEKPKLLPKQREIFLPMPRLSGDMSVEEAIARRRSVREYLDSPLKIEEISQLLWSAQGITDVRRGFRVAPSAGATYPLEVYLVVREGGVEGLEPGIYKYDSHRHSLMLLKLGDFSKELYSAALNQEWVLEAPINLVVTAVYERTTSRYGERGIRYVHMEVGHVGQNVYLQATALNLGTVVIGAFHDEEVKRIISVPDEVPLYIMPVGRVRRLHELTQQELEEYYNERRGG